MATMTLLHFLLQCYFKDGIGLHCLGRSIRYLIRVPLLDRAFYFCGIMNNSATDILLPLCLNRTDYAPGREGIQWWEMEEPYFTFLILSLVGEAERTSVLHFCLEGCCLETIQTLWHHPLKYLMVFPSLNHQ